jgi:hypothetical protein
MALIVIRPHGTPQNDNCRDILQSRKDAVTIGVMDDVRDGEIIDDVAGRHFWVILDDVQTTGHNASTTLTDKAVLYRKGAKDAKKFKYL